MPVVRATRRVHFSAAHRLFRSDWPDERNSEVFGDCSNQSWHGHNYELEVTVRGDVDPETGMVINLSEIAAVLHEEVFSRIDHRHLSEELPEWKSKIPTTENLAIDIWNRLVARLERPHARLYRVRLYESPNLFAEYYGNDTSSLA